MASPLNEYAEFVEDRFAVAKKEPSRVVFTNRGSANAKIVLRALIQNTTKSLNMFTGCLSQDVYDAALLKTCARRLAKGQLRILIADRPISEPTALTYLRDEVENGTILLKQLSDVTSGEVYQHFTLSDDAHLRVERDHLDKTAVVVLNCASEDIGKQYKALFELLWSSAAAFDWSQVKTAVAA